MAITLTCRNCEDVTFPCCGGGSSTETFKGLEIDEDGTITRIYYPFDVSYSTSAAVVSDLKGTVFTILLSETSYASMAELKSAINSCLCPTSSGEGNGGTTVSSNGESCCGSNAVAAREVFIDATGTTITVTEAPIPEENIPILLEVYRDGGKAIYGYHFEVDTAQGEIIFNRALEGEHVEVIIKNCSSAVYENFLDATGQSVTLTENDLGGVLLTWEEEEFLELDATNEVTIVNAPLPRSSVGANLYVLRDGGKAIHNYHFTIDYANNKLVFNRAFEVENLVVRYRPNDPGQKDIRVYRDGGEAIEGYHYTIDYENNQIVFTSRDLEGEHVQVYIE